MVLLHQPTEMGSVIFSINLTTIPYIGVSSQTIVPFFFFFFFNNDRFQRLVGTDREAL
jgi:hypothetical protein